MCVGWVASPLYMVTTLPTNYYKIKSFVIHWMILIFFSKMGYFRSSDGVNMNSIIIIDHTIIIGTFN